MAVMAAGPSEARSSQQEGPCLAPCPAYRRKRSSSVSKRRHWGQDDVTMSSRVSSSLLSLAWASKETVSVDECRFNL